MILYQAQVTLPIPALRPGLPTARTQARVSTGVQLLFLSVNRKEPCPGPLATATFSERHSHNSIFLKTLPFLINLTYNRSCL